jgi:hypothetical protein
MLQMRMLEHDCATLAKYGIQRQTVVSQFFQMDRLVVEGGKTVSPINILLGDGRPQNLTWYRANKRVIGTTL